ncbi:MAG TPA: glucokinase [Rhodocyclaceae bacterium]|nr:glucokinase [Rhodocyclaceae bacterium]
MVLAGDIGGTKALLALAEPGADAPRIVFQRRYACAEDASADALLGSFIADVEAAGQPLPTVGCLGVAGPVRDQRVRLTNLPWELDGELLARRLRLFSLILINDFVAAAHGLGFVQAANRAPVWPAEPDPHAPAVILGPGTGLGVAVILRDERGTPRVLPGEGGHMGFAPRDARQAGLLQWLARQHPRVTVERVLSGPGLVAIYRFLAEQTHTADLPDPLKAADAAAAIGTLAQSRPGSLAAQAVALFADALGAFAGDLGLLLDARAGVFICGGVAARLAPLLSEPLKNAFLEKSEHDELIRAMPLYLVREERLGLFGAASIGITRA